MKRFFVALLVVFGGAFIAPVANAVNNCTGATYYDSDSDTCITCPAGYDANTDAGKTDITQCQISCLAGTYVATVGIVGYTQLEYIANTGTQWIDTGIVRSLNHNYRLQTGIEWANTTNRQLVGVQGFYYVGCINGKFQITQSGTASTQINAVSNTKYDIDVLFDYANRAASGYINNDYYDFNTNVNYAGSPVGGKFAVFSLNDATLISENAKQYYYKLYDNDVLVRDMIPARRNSDGVLGMYDKVTDTFFANSGTGTFIAGPDVGSCENVGTGYYAGASTVNYGSAGTRTACPAGTYSNIENAASCTSCTGATYSGMAATSCTTCPAGYVYNTTLGKTSVTQCQTHCNAGTYVENAGDPENAVPGGYTRLEYIANASDGGQWIDTGIKRNLQNYRLVVGVEFSNVSTRQIIGAQGSFYVGVVDNKFQISGGGTKTVNYTANANAKYIIDTTFKAITNKLDYLITDGNDNVIANQTNVNPQASYVLDPAGAKFGVFSLNDGLIPMLGGKTYFYKLYDKDGILLRNMVPVRRNSGGEIGMYDTVTRTFFTNSGTGTFIAGPDVASGCINVGAGYYAAESVVNYGSGGTRTACPAGTYSNIENAASCTSCAGATYNDIPGAAACTACPTGYTYNTTAGKTSITECQVHCDGGTYVLGYTQLEYLESTGTQYIDTGILPNEKTEAEIDFSNYSGNSWLFFASQGSWSSNNFGIILNEQTRFYMNCDGHVTNYSRPANFSANIKLSLTGVYIDGTKVSTTNCTIPPSKFNTVRSLILFGGNNTGTPSGGAKVRVNYFKLWENGVLVRNFVPVRRNSDGVLGMYDTVNNVFYTNAGTGTFIAGLDIGTIISGGCINVGAGYWAAESTTNFGSVGTRNACPAGLTTVGYGHGADSANDCARVLHIDDKVLYARRDKITTPSLNIAVPNEGTYYISLSPTDHTLSRLHFSYDGNKYTAYDDSLFYGERDFDTGQPITQ